MSFETRREHPRIDFQCFVIEHRPEDTEHPQATRTLKCLDFSKGGMRLEGTPRYNRFKATVCMPPNKDQIECDVEVVHQTGESFGVKFIRPSEDLVSKIDWFYASSDLDFLEDNSGD